MFGLALRYVRLLVTHVWTSAAAVLELGSPAHKIKHPYDALAKVGASSFCPSIVGLQMCTPLSTVASAVWHALLMVDFCQMIKTLLGAVLALVELALLVLAVVVVAALVVLVAVLDAEVAAAVAAAVVFGAFCTAVVGGVTTNVPNVATMKVWLCSIHATTDAYVCASFPSAFVYVYPILRWRKYFQMT